MGVNAQYIIIINLYSILALIFNAAKITKQANKRNTILCNIVYVNSTTRGHSIKTMKKKRSSLMKLWSIGSWGLFISLLSSHHRRWKSEGISQMRSCSKVLFTLRLVTFAEFLPHSPFLNVKNVSYYMFKISMLMQSKNELQNHLKGQKQ